VYLVHGGKIDTMRAFLHHVLNGLIIDEYRKRKTTSLDAILEKGFDPGFDDSNRFVNYLDGKKVVLLVDTLPQKYQKVVRLRYVQGFSLDEVSLLTKQSRNTVAVQAHRGLAKLKKLYYQTNL